VATVASEDGRCRIIMQDGVLLPGMRMPVLGPPPPDPHRNPIIQTMRDAWNLNVIAWDAVWDQRPRWLFRRSAGHWRDPVPPRRAAEPFEQRAGDAEVEGR